MTGLTALVARLATCRRGQQAGCLVMALRVHGARDQHGQEQNRPRDGRDGPQDAFRTSQMQACCLSACVTFASEPAC